MNDYAGGETILKNISSVGPTSLHLNPKTLITLLRLNYKSRLEYLEDLNLEHKLVR